MSFMRFKACERVSPIDPIIAEGIATTEIRDGMLALVDACYRAALNDPDGLQYRNISPCDPRDEVAKECFKKDGGTLSIETAMTDVRLMEVHIDHRGEPMKPLFVKILGVRPNNGVMISGRMKYFAAILGDRCISTNVTADHARLFVRFYRAKFQVNEISVMISVNGLFKAVPVPWAQIHNDKTDKSGKKTTTTGRRGKAKPTIFLYLLAVYGLYEAFERVAGAVPVFTTTDDVDRHKELTKKGYVPVLSTPAKKKVPLNIIAWIKEDQCTVDMCNCLASLFYTMEYRPNNTNTIEKIENKTVWLVVLGIINSGDEFAYATLAQAMSNHIDSVYRYFDAPSKEKFEELGIYVNDTYELLSYLMTRTHAWLQTGNSKIIDVTNKQVSVLAEIAYAVTSAAFLLNFKYHQMRLKRLDVPTLAEAERLCRMHIKRGNVFEANRSPATKSLAVVGDRRLPCMTNLVDPTRQGSRKGNKTITYSPSDATHGSLLYNMQTNRNPSSSPFGRAALNPFTRIHKGLLLPPENLEEYNELNDLLSRKL